MSAEFGRGARIVAVVALALGALGWGSPAGADHHEDPPGEAREHSGHGHAGSHGEHGGPGHDDGATVTHGFEDAADWASRFEDPARDAWQLPDRVVGTLVTRPDMSIADIGSATGYFPVRFARAAPGGMVIGADVEPDMVRYLNDRARKEGLGNLVSVLAGYDDPHLPRPVDLVFICNTYHHIDGRVDYFGRLAEQIRPGGRLAVVDYRPDSPRGPRHKLPAEKVIEELVAAGYVLEAQHEFLPDQYFLVFAAPRR